MNETYWAWKKKRGRKTEIWVNLKNNVFINQVRAWCKSGTRTLGPGTRDPPQSLKVGPS